MTTDGGQNMLSLTALGLLTVLISAVPLNELASNTSNAMAFHHFFQRGISQDISFQEKGAVHGITEDGCEFSSTGWESSDGVVVFLKIYYCKSPANAQRVLNKLTKDATKVFEKRTLTSKDGKKTGERIVAAFSKDSIKHPEMILWTDGNEIYMVESTSFAHALIFEKKFPNI
jgi:hypothetical protein